MQGRIQPALMGSAEVYRVPKWQHLSAMPPAKFRMPRPMIFSSIMLKVTYRSQAHGYRSGETSVRPAADKEDRSAASWSQH